VPNHDLTLTPGLFGRVRVSLGTPAATLLVPDAAVLADQAQHLVLTVAADGTVVPKTVELGELSGTQRVIRSGLVAGDPGHRGGAPFSLPPVESHRASTGPSNSNLGCKAVEAGSIVGFSHFFIDHPRFATVLSIFLTALGLAALAVLPIAQYPAIVPPTIQITTRYPGASAETIARTVATPLEQEINGVENMLYLSSQSTGDGNLTITVTFRVGSDLNVAQMLTQNRVQDALSRLPDDVQRQGIQVRKTTPAILLAVHVYSPDGSRNPLYESNYLTLRIKDVIARLPGVGDVQFQGERQYAMRVWLDPDQAAAHDVNASEIAAPLTKGVVMYKTNVGIQETMQRRSTPKGS